MTSEQIKARISFANDKEQAEFDQYFPIRGLGVYQDTLRVLETLMEVRPISFVIFSGLIRYDKQLRDVIYKYVAALEEFWRNYLCTKCEYLGDEIFNKVNKKNESDFITLPPDKDYGWKLYRNPVLDLGSLLHIYTSLDLMLPTGVDPNSVTIKQIKELRNIIMHHRMVTVDQSISCPSKKSIDEYTMKISASIESLTHTLPENYRLGFQKELYQCNYDKRNGNQKSPYINFDKYGVK
jgi:hypothetical protein